MKAHVMFRNIHFMHFILCCFELSAAQKTLKLVHVLYRHGDRSPTHTYPNDPYKDYPWPQGLGQLTQTGMRQQLHLGEWLRQRYIDVGFMNRTYYNNEIYVRSTDYDRTIQSAQSNVAGLFPPGGFQSFDPDVKWQPVTIHSVPFDYDWLFVRSTDKDRAIHSALSNLAGLYPPEGFQQFDPDIKWQPIAVHTWPEEVDRVLWMDKECERYSEMYVQGLLSDEYKELYEDNKERLEYAAEKAGYPTVVFDQLWDVYDTLYCQNVHNLSWPSWVTEDLFKQLWAFSALEYLFDSFNNEMTVFRAGPFITQLSNNIQNKMLNKLEPAERKMFMYSAHDSTLAAVMFAMNVWNNITPPYCAMLMWELYDSPEGSVVNVLLKNSTTEDPYPMVLPGCEFDCPADKFLSLLAPMKFEGDWVKECHDKGNLSHGSFIAIAVIAGILLVVVAGVAAWCVKRHRRHSEYLPVVEYEP